MDAILNIATAYLIVTSPEVKYESRFYAHLEKEFIFVGVLLDYTHGHDWFGDGEYFVGDFLKPAWENIGLNFQVAECDIYSQMYGRERFSEVDNYILKRLAKLRAMQEFYPSRREKFEDEIEALEDFRKFNHHFFIITQPYYGNFQRRKALKAIYDELGPELFYARVVP